MDTQGLPHAIAVTTADVTDRQGALNAIGQRTENLSAVSVVLTDGGYTLGGRKVIRLAGKASKTLEKHGTVT